MSLSRRKCDVCDDGYIKISLVKAYKTLICSHCSTRFKLAFYPRELESFVIGLGWLLVPALVVVAIFAVWLAIALAMLPTAFILFMRRFGKLQVYKEGFNVGKQNI